MWQAKFPELDQLLGGGLERGPRRLCRCRRDRQIDTGRPICRLDRESRQPAPHCLPLTKAPHTLFARTKGVGIELDEMVEKGSVTIQQIDPAELSPGEFTHAIREAVDKDISVLIIDSLNGYLNAMPDERFLIIQLHELLTYLGQQNVATILIGAHTGLIGSAMQTPIDASYLADAVILMRYYETRGEVRQAISVIKKRGGTHERTVRDFRLSSDGIIAGPPAPAISGVC